MAGTEKYIYAESVEQMNKLVKEFAGDLETYYVNGAMGERPLIPQLREVGKIKRKSGAAWIANEDVLSLSQGLSNHPTPQSSIIGVRNKDSESASYSLHAKTKLTYIDTIVTPNSCFSVAFQSYITEATSSSEMDNKHAIFHGGERYNRLNGAQSNVNINCVRSFGMNLLIQVEKNMENDITEVVAYDRATLSVATYVPGHKIRVNFNSVYITHITKIDDVLVQTGADRGKIYFFRYSTGELIATATHPDLKHPLGICHDEQTKDIYVTDNVGFSIFKLTISGNDITIEKLAGSRVAKPIGITMHDGKLLVVSNIIDDPKLHILTTSGEVVTVIGLSECKGAKVLDVSVNHLEGRIAIANRELGVHIYQIDRSVPA